MKTDFRAQTFNAANAEFLGRASNLAYESETKITATLAGWDMRLERFFDVQDTQAFLAADDEKYILAFRGTDFSALKDWMTDADIQQVNGPAGKVHEGFLCAVNSIWRELWKILDQQRGQRSLWVTGHSLGGALATLAVAKIRLEKAHPVDGLYTFGQPRVGDADFAYRFDQDFKDRTFRFVNNQDIVPRVPLRVLNYHDTGTFKFFDQYGKLDVKATWESVLLNRLGNTIRDVLDLEDVKDHLMANYLDNLNWLVNPKLPKPR
jgi:triacylglycerol lipase